VLDERSCDAQRAVATRLPSTASVAHFNLAGTGPASSPQIGEQQFRERARTSCRLVVSAAGGHDRAHEQDLQLVAGLLGLGGAGLAGVVFERLGAHNETTNVPVVGVAILIRRLVQWAEARGPVEVRTPKQLVEGVEQR
jgi:hypothetical protein